MGRCLQSQCHGTSETNRDTLAEGGDTDMKQGNIWHGQHTKHAGPGLQPVQQWVRRLGVRGQQWGPHLPGVGADLVAVGVREVEVWRAAATPGRVPQLGAGEGPQRAAAGPRAAGSPPMADGGCRGRWVCPQHSSVGTGGLPTMGRVGEGDQGRAGGGAATPSAAQSACHSSRRRLRKYHRTLTCRQGWGRGVRPAGGGRVEPCVGGCGALVSEFPGGGGA